MEEKRMKVFWISFKCKNNRTKVNNVQVKPCSFQYPVCEMFVYKIY